MLIFGLVFVTWVYCSLISVPRPLFLREYGTCVLPGREFFSDWTFELVWVGFQYWKLTLGNRVDLERPDEVHRREESVVFPQVLLSPLRMIAKSGERP